MMRAVRRGWLVRGMLRRATVAATMQICAGSVRDRALERAEKRARDKRR
jgi:hypothetical protein